jgi:hypothetical protein
MTRLNPGRLVGLSIVVALLSAAPALAQNEEDTVTFGPRTAVPRVPCHPDDRPETDMQGRVPPADLLNGRAAQGYNCNLELVGQFPGSSAGSFDTFQDCAYFGVGAVAGFTEVVDVSNSARPVATAVLNTPAMMDPWEGLRVNAKRKLLVSGSNYNTYLDIYSVADDCRHPKLISSTDMAPARGHEGWFSPDGLTYYMSSTGAENVPTVFPIDISDPAHPKQLASWSFRFQTHGGFTTEDGKTSYICRQFTPPYDALMIVDTSDIAARRPNPMPTVRTRIGLGDNQWCQDAIPVTYGGHPYLIQAGERAGHDNCARSEDNWATFAYPRIFDLADEANPKLVSTALLESALPQNCATVKGEGAINGLGYSVHHCSVDRLYDPTILACDYFFAGMRVTDIRDPAHPVELGYYNPGVGVVVSSGARPVVRAERREIWFVNDSGGFYVVRFRDGVWPFKGSARCPEFDDHYYAQYNPGSTCPTANLNGIGKPPPRSVAPAATVGRLTRITVTSRGRRPRVRFVASAAGRVVVDVRRGARRLQRRTVSVHRGAVTLHMRAVRAGRYTVDLRVVGGSTHHRRLRIR